jgi:hypothetical protein
MSPKVLPGVMCVYAGCRAALGPPPSPWPCRAAGQMHVYTFGAASDPGPVPTWRVRASMIGEVWLLVGLDQSAPALQCKPSAVTASCVSRQTTGACCGRTVVVDHETGYSPWARACACVYCSALTTRSRGPAEQLHPRCCFWGQACGASLGVYNVSAVVDARMLTWCKGFGCAWHQRGYQVRSIRQL